MDEWLFNTHLKGEKYKIVWWRVIWYFDKPNKALDIIATNKYV